MLAQYFVRFSKAHDQCCVSKTHDQCCIFQSTLLVLHFSKCSISAVFSKSALLAQRFFEPCYILTSICVSQRHSPRLYITYKRYFYIFSTMINSTHYCTRRFPPRFIHCRCYWQLCPPFQFHFFFLCLLPSCFAPALTKIDPGDVFS